MAHITWVFTILSEVALVLIQSKQFCPHKFWIWYIRFLSFERGKYVWQILLRSYFFLFNTTDSVKIAPFPTDLITDNKCPNVLNEYIESVWLGYTLHALFTTTQITLKLTWLFTRDQSKSGSFHACYTVEIQDKKIPLKSIDFVLFGFNVYEIYDKLLG